MTIPLLSYAPSSQNQRVPGYEVPNEDTPWRYSLEDVVDQSDIDELIWAAYRQVFSEHVVLKSTRQPHLESQLASRAISVRDFIRGLAKSETFRRLVVETNSNYRLVEIALKRLLGRAPYNKDEELAYSFALPPTVGRTLWIPLWIVTNTHKTLAITLCPTSVVAIKIAPLIW